MIGRLFCLNRIIENRSLVSHPSVLRDVRRISESVGEVFVGVGGAKDGHALHGKDVAAAVDVAVFDGESALVSRFPGDLRDVEVVNARGVRDEFDGVSELTFGVFFGLDEFFADALVGEFGERCVGNGV